ncbi:MAG: hypothetical protein AAF316_00915 [Cyanobacteria bacterium P01_A01_bin.80]
MSDSPKFKIRRINPEEEQKPQPDSPEKTSEQNPKTEQNPTNSSKTPTTQSKQDTLTAGYFRTAGNVLAFIGSVFGSRLSETANLLRTPQGKWWVEVSAPHQNITPLIWSIGGRPFIHQNQDWIPLSLSGDLTPETKNLEKLDVSSWKTVDLAELLASTSLPPNRYRGVNSLDVITPGSLGRWILRRATANGLDVTLTPVLQSPLSHQHEHQKNTGVLLMQLRATKNRIISPAFVNSLTSLPYTTVAVSSPDTEAGETEEAAGRILVDVRQRLSVASSFIESMIPEDEIWVLGTVDVGSWRLTVTGNQIDGSLLLDAPQLPQVLSPPQANAEVPAPIPVQLVSRPGTARQVDAVLLDDMELSWLRNVLIGRPVGEMAFILPGAGYHLLTAPGGLPAQIPFGIPLVNMGPGAFYIELGKDFYPSLPDAARQQRFELNPQTAVVVAPNHTYRFNTTNIVPAWILWVGEAPTVQEGLSPQAKKLLNNLNSISPTSQQQQGKKGLFGIFNKPNQVKPVEEVGLLEQAQQAELQGDFAKAAALLEKGGYTGQAGRLYERIASEGVA